MYKQNLCSTILLIEDISSVRHGTDTSDRLHSIKSYSQIIIGVDVSVSCSVSMCQCFIEQSIKMCLTAIEKDAYESALLWQTSRAPNGPPFSLHIAGIITNGKPPMFPG